jgi:UDP-glucose 4-epimerase
LKILIFGGTGFVGINIAAALLARGHRVTLFDRIWLARPLRLPGFGGRSQQLVGAAWGRNVTCG